MLRVHASDAHSSVRRRADALAGPRPETRNEEIIRRVTAGESYGQVARSLGISRGAVAGCLDRHRRGDTKKLVGRRIGSQHPVARLSEEVIPEIRQRLEWGETFEAIARDYGVGSGTIWRIYSGETWKHVA